MTNRWIQLGASLLGMIMIANHQLSWTLVDSPLQQAHGWKLSDIQWAFTLFIVFETWMMPLEGWLIDRLGPRIFISIAAVLCAIGWSGLAFARNLPELYTLYAIAGVGAACVYSGCMATGLKWFPDKRGLAAGIIAGGFGSGSGLLIPLIAHIISVDGYRTAFLYTGVLQGILIFCAAQLMRNPPHHDPPPPTPTPSPLRVSHV